MLSTRIENAPGRAVRTVSSSGSFGGPKVVTVASVIVSGT